MTREPYQACLTTNRGKRSDKEICCHAAASYCRLAWCGRHTKHRWQWRVDASSLGCSSTRRLARQVDRVADCQPHEPVTVQLAISNSREIAIAGRESIEVVVMANPDTEHCFGFIGE